MSAPSIMGMRSSMRTWPIGVPSKLGRQAYGAGHVPATPRDINRVRVVKGRKVLPNRGAVILRGDRG